MRFLSMVPVFVLAAVILAACAPDPYNIHPQTLKVERAVVGESALELQKPRTGINEYSLFEGKPFSDGGIVFKPFYLVDVEVTPEVGAAILARKNRYGRVFGLLVKGAAGEAADARLTPRVSMLELTESERKLIEEENADRELIIRAFAAGKKIPEVDIGAIRRVFAYSRFQLMPEGILFERQPGEWIVKGGRDYRARVMARDPVILTPPSENEFKETQPVIQPGQPRIRVRPPREGA